MVNAFVGFSFTLRKFMVQNAKKLCNVISAVIPKSLIQNLARKPTILIKMAHKLPQ
jgi:hypothetical protein